MIDGMIQTDVGWKENLIEDYIVNCSWGKDLYDMTQKSYTFDIKEKGSKCQSLEKVCDIDNGP